MKHTLTNKDIENKIGDCAVCGRVNLKIRDNRSPQCYNAWRQQKGTNKKPKDGWPKRDRLKHRFSYPYDGGIIYMTRSERNRIFEMSNQMCCICQDELTLESANYDHCHKTGVFRGWLCRGCNAGLGFFRDDLAIMSRAMKYLEH